LAEAALAAPNAMTIGDNPIPFSDSVKVERSTRVKSRLAGDCSAAFLSSFAPALLF
jgi:hypothetical protein